MAKKVIKTLGEGGAHAHRLLLDIQKTAFDGIHKHLFFVNDRILMTDLSGDHEHNFNPSSGEVGPELQKHRHVISVRTEQGPVQFPTSEGASHSHELQVNATTTSGVHEHTVSIMDELFVSLVPGDLINEVMAASKSIKKFKTLSFKRSDDPMEMDFSLVKRLNQKQYKEILMKGVESLIIKRMTKLGEGLRIESLILSLERFADVGVATRFVLDQGLDIKSSQVLLDQGVFTFQVMSRSSFEETTLQRIRITEGVEAVIGFMAEKDEPANENVVASEDIDELTDVEQTKSLNLVNWNSQETISGSFQALLSEISEKFEINRKFVCVDYPRSGLVKYVEDNFEILHAAYDDIMDEEYKSVVSMQAQNENMDIFVTDFGKSKTMIFFFDDEEEMKKVYGADTVDYAPGTYMVKQTMCGHVLIPVNVQDTNAPIFDDDVIASMERDTNTFFEKRDFFLNNPIERLAHKRGIFMIGKPGNGKTTFIKHFLSKTTKENDRYGIIIDCSDGFDSSVGKYLESVLGDKEKVIVLEDIDSIAENSYQRASLLNFIDGIESMDKTLFIATSNNPEKLDEAILNRRSRFDKKYFIDLPSEKMREKFLARFFPEMNEGELIEHAKLTEGFSGADFKEIFILTNLQDISTEKAIGLLHEQINMIYKNKKDFIPSIKALFFEGLENKDSLMGLKQKFEDTMSKFDIDKRRHNDKKPKKDKKEDEEKSTFKCVYNILSKNEEKRLITGPVLIPDNIDLQDDIISSPEIEKAAHGYMIKLAFRDDPEFLKSLGFMEVGKAGERGFQHIDFSRKLAVVETFIAPVDFELNGRMILKGTWVMTMKVFDDEVWALVKTGKITGFSIGGRSKSRPAKNKK